MGEFYHTRATQAGVINEIDKGKLLGVGNLMISFEKRWSAWRVLVVSIAIWHILYLIGSFSDA